MKLRNKKTGEIVDLIEIVKLDDVSNEFYLRLSDSAGRTFKIGFNSLAELNEVWEDYEMQKEYYCIDWTEPDGIYKTKYEDVRDEFNKEVGNYFNTREEAEKAVEKLKAAKRLKDKGFRLLGYYHRLGETKSKGEIGFEMNDYAGTKQDLDLLFGGEE